MAFLDLHVDQFWGSEDVLAQEFNLEFHVCETR